MFIKFMLSIPSAWVCATRPLWACSLPASSMWTVVMLFFSSTSDIVDQGGKDRRNDICAKANKGSRATRAPQ